MILLITSSARVQECMAAIQEMTGEEAVRAESRHAASAQLRSTEYSAVVIDQCLLEPDPDIADQVLLQYIGGAIPVYVNLAISGSERVAREVQTALKRRQRETAIAQRAAETALRNELKGSLTAVLLSCQMAMGVQGLPSSAAARIKSIHEAALEMRSHLGLQEPEVVSQ
jgi:hypothetical protein